MHRRVVWTALCLALTLAACGQNSGGTPPGPKTYSKLGLVAYGGLDGKQGVFAAFGTREDGLTFTSPDPSVLDTCLLGEGAGQNLFQFLYPVLPQGNLEAGLALSLSRNGTVFASVPIQSQTSNDVTTTAYQLNVNLDGFTGVTVSAPGGGSGGFPAFSGVPLPVPAQAFTFTSPADPSAVTPDATFTWTAASNDPAGVVLMAVRQQNPDVRFFCVARDDGGFTIPADFQALLTNQKFTKGQLQAYQSLYHSTPLGDALLFTGRLLKYPPDLDR